MLYLIRGVPGSGKSTLAQSFYDHGIVDVVLEADMYFLEGGKYNFDAKKLPEAHAWCLQETKDYLEDGLVVAVANTFVKRAHLLPYYEIGCPVIELVVRSVEAVVHLFSRNQHGVPLQTIDRMIKEFEL